MRVYIVLGAWLTLTSERVLGHDESSRIADVRGLRGKCYIGCVTLLHLYMGVASWLTPPTNPNRFWVIQRPLTVVIGLRRLLKNGATPIYVYMGVASQ